MAVSGTRPLRLVLDTNVVVAGLLWNGPPRRLIELAIEGGVVEHFSSAVLLDEFAHTLGYFKFAARIEGFWGLHRRRCWPSTRRSCRW